MQGLKPAPGANFESSLASERRSSDGVSFRGKNGKMCEITAIMSTLEAESYSRSQSYL